MVRKLIVHRPENVSFERCSSSAYKACALYLTAPETAMNTGQCPYLDDSLMQYCAAAPVPKLIPYSEAGLSRCGSGGFQYCDLYLSMAHPDAAELPQVEGMAVPSWLYYSANHMWLDVSADGLYHIGIDAFLARTLSTVDHITHLTGRGVSHPAVVLSSGASDFHMVFPNRMLVTGQNVYLRSNPERLISDPYRAGWLLECRPAPDGPDPATGLYSGEQALRWMQAEFNRMDAFAHAHAGISSCKEDVLMADGGSFAPDLVQHLDRAQTAQLFHDFFSPASMR